MSTVAITASNPAETRRAAMLGFATQLLLRTERRKLRLASFTPFLLPPIRLDQIGFLYNSHGRPIAYATWAFLTEQVSGELEGNPDRLLSLPEWNEGADLWLMDVVAPSGGAAMLLSELATKQLARHERIRAVRRDAEGEVRRIVDLRRPRESRVGLGR